VRVGWDEIKMPPPGAKQEGGRKERWGKSKKDENPKTHGDFCKTAAGRGESQGESVDEVK
jgi:hypothetical protein